MAKIDNNTNKVVNVIEAPDDWSEDGFTFIINDKVNKGDIWNGIDFVPPIPDPPSADDVRRGILEDKARRDQVMTVRELTELFKLKFLT